MLRKEIERIYEASRKTYGSPRITAALRKQGYRCSRPRVARIMARHNIAAKTKRKFKATTQSAHSYPVSPNLVGQNFNSDHPNRVWTSDITYIRTREGWLYLTVVQDVFNREIVGWSMGKNLTAKQTVIPAFQHASARLHKGDRLIFHSDQGSQYACDVFRSQLAGFNVQQSMSGAGNCYDNAMTESFFHTLKTELVYFERYHTRAQARASIFEYIEVFYNRQRLHSALDYQTPVQFALLKNAA